MADDFKLTNDNYYSQEANKEFMSVSQFKDFYKCEAMAMAKLNGEFSMEKTTPLLVGSYVDSYFEGTLDTFKEYNPEIFKKDGDLKANYKQAEEIIKRIEQDKLFMEYMSGKKQEVYTGELFGTKWKIKIDSLLQDKIVDLKVMRSIERIMGMSFVEYWHYDWQLAIYSKIYEIATGKKLPTYIAVATKEKTTNLEIINIPDWRLEECLDEIEKLIPRVLFVKNEYIKPERCGICDYCRTTKVLTEPIGFEEVGFSNKELKIMRGEG